MQITSIAVHQIDLPLHEGRYSWSGGKSVDVFDSTLVIVTTDEGITGCGEVCPLGPVYLPAYAAGARAGIRELAPALIGESPLDPVRLNRMMDKTLKGHPYVKSAIDVACWDIMGKAYGQPVSRLLGGTYDFDLPIYRAISQRSPEEMATNIQGYVNEGYHRFQLKVGADPLVDIQRIHACREVLDANDILIADANTGWTAADAARVVRGVRDLDVFIEQPCESYVDCVSIRRRTDHPFVLDEVVNGIDTLLTAKADNACDAINIKISKFGGLTKARQARDLAVEMGLMMTIEDSWGGDVVTAAITHLAQSTPPEHLLTTTDFNSYVTKPFAEGAPYRDGGLLRASTAPGLGCEPMTDVIGEAVFVVD